MRQKVKLVLLGTFVILLDQISKNTVQAKWAISCNKGIAFGIGLAPFWGILLSVVILTFIFYLIVGRKSASSQVGLALILGGGVSNLIDRLTIGCVRDFINIPLWPTSFNLADAAISLGVTILILTLFWGKLWDLK